MPSDEFKSFKDVFGGLSKTSKESKKLRDTGWNQADPNGNGHCSLAELDSWVKDSLVAKKGDDEGDTVWKRFRPSYIRAFNDAKDVMKNKKISTSSDLDDYVQKREFRCFVAYLVIYAEMYDAFSLLDGGGEGVSKDDDRKISIDELKAGIGKLESFSFIGLDGLDDSMAEGLFAQMDADGKGSVLLVEWCRFIEKAEQAEQTEIGKLLNIGDDDDGGTDFNMSKCKRMFDFFDKDKSGNITTKELGNVMRCGGLNPTEEELKAKMKECDTNGDGTVSWAEFKKNIDSFAQKKSKKPADIKKSFKVFDKNGDGKIDLKEFRKLCTSMGEKLTDKEIDTLLEEADENGDGKLSYQEFVDFMLS